MMFSSYVTVYQKLLILIFWSVKDNPKYIYMSPNYYLSIRPEIPAINAKIFVSSINSNYKLSKFLKKMHLCVSFE